MSARIGVASKTPTLPQEPNVFVHRESRELLSPFWSFDNEKNGFLVNFIKATLILITFQWTSWGNQTKDIKAQSIQEVTNFGILSALSLALNISIVVTVDGNDDWPTNSTWRQAMGVIFNLASSAHVISLLASAFLLLIINETPEGRAVVLVIDHLGVWMRLPGFAFMVGVYGFCALICCWQMHTFDLTISIAVCAFCVIVASVSLFGAVVTGLQGLYKVVSAYALLTIADDAAIKTLRELFLSAKQTCLHADGIVVGYRRDEFYDWILEQYHCCEFCDITRRRLDRCCDTWESEQAAL